jgi:hypothetical protein
MYRFPVIVAAPSTVLTQMLSITEPSGQIAMLQQLFNPVWDFILAG